MPSMQQVLYWKWVLNQVVNISTISYTCISYESKFNRSDLFMRQISVTLILAYHRPLKAFLTKINLDLLWSRLLEPLLLKIWVSAILFKTPCLALRNSMHVCDLATFKILSFMPKGRELVITFAKRNYNHRWYWIVNLRRDKDNK